MCDMHIEAITRPSGDAGYSSAEGVTFRGWAVSWVYGITTGAFDVRDKEVTSGDPTRD
jgi:hypothetical protein